MQRKWTKEQFIEAVKSSTNTTSVIVKLGLVNLGGNYRTIKENIKKYNLDISHFTRALTAESLKSRKLKQKFKVTNEEIFVRHEEYHDTKIVKARIIKHNLLPYKCAHCSITEWQGQELSLHLDHTNGNNADNRLENLRFLCPNCHSLTPTYCGRNVKNKRTPKFCCDCNAPVMFDSIRCKTCKAKSQPTKINWLPINELIALVKELGFAPAGKILGVSDTAIRKHLTRNGINYKSIKKLR
jgi:Zn finger protein HypA/HybF involved in hydrogenase expression